MDINDTGTRERSWMRNSLLENYRQMLPPGKVCLKHPEFAPLQNFAAHMPLLFPEMSVNQNQRELVDADVTQMQANRAPQVLRVPKTPHGASAPQPMQVGDLIRAPAKTAVQVGLVVQQFAPLLPHPPLPNLVNILRFFFHR